MPAPTMATSASTLVSGSRLELRPRIDRRLDDARDPSALLPLERQPRGADPLAAFARHLVGELDVLHQLGRHIEVQQRHEPAVEIDGLGNLVGPGELIELHRFAREGIGETRYPAAGAEEGIIEEKIVDTADD